MRRTKKYLAKIFFSVVIIMFLQTLSTYGADIYTTQPDTSIVGFKVTNFGISFVQGRFEKFKGAFTFEGNQLTHFEGVVDMSSLDTGIRMRDDDLRSDNFFSTKKFPTMTIKSKKMFQSGNDITIQSDLTIRGITKLIELHGKVDHFSKIGQADLMLEGIINRKDFGLRLNKIFEIFIGDNVTISLKLKAEKTYNS